MSNSWKYVPLEDAVDIFDNMRKPINSTERAERIAGKDSSRLFPYYGATGQVGLIDSYLTDDEYVLLGEDGAPFLDMYANKAYIISGKAWVNNHAHILRSKFSNRFLCYYLNFFNYKGYVSGTTRLKLTQAEMKKIPVPIPPLSEQERIVAHIEELFSQLDSGVETLKKTKQQLEVYRQAVYNSAFQVVEVTKPFSDFFEVSGGVTKNSQRSEYQLKMPYLRVANVYYNQIDLSEIKEIGIKENELEKCTLQINDILFVEGNGSKSQIGRVAIWRGELSECVHQNHIIKGRPRGNMLSDYALYYFMSSEGRKQIIDVAKSTSGLYTLSTNKIKELTVPYCELEKQKTIVSEIEERLSEFEQIEKTVKKAIEQAAAIRQSILKKAFEGM